MKWPARISGGVERDFSHLDDSEIYVTPKNAGAPTYRVRVSYELHCFARTANPDDPADHLFPEGQNMRCFCPDRYRCSLELPRIIAAAPSSRVFFSQRRDMLVVEQLPGLVGPYAIFFNAEKFKRGGYDAALFVVSAYEKPELPTQLPAVSFATLISNLVNARPLNIPRETRKAWG